VTGPSKIRIFDLWCFVPEVPWEIGIVVSGGHKQTRGGRLTFLASSSPLLIASPPALTGEGHVRCSPVATDGRCLTLVLLMLHYNRSNWSTLMVSTSVPGSFVSSPQAFTFCPTSLEASAPARRKVP